MWRKVRYNCIRAHNHKGKEHDTTRRDVHRYVRPHLTLASPKSSKTAALEKKSQAGLVRLPRRIKPVKTAPYSPPPHGQSATYERDAHAVATPVLVRERHCIPHAYSMNNTISLLPYDSCLHPHLNDEKHLLPIRGTPVAWSDRSDITTCASRRRSVKQSPNFPRGDGRHGITKVLPQLLSTCTFPIRRKYPSSRQ